MLTFSYVQEKAGAAGWPHGDIVLHNSPIVMPLKEWIEHPLVREVVHDGETLQVRPFPRLESIRTQPLWGTGLAHHSLASSAPTSASVVSCLQDPAVSTQLYICGPCLPPSSPEMSPDLAGPLLSMSPQAYQAHASQPPPIGIQPEPSTQRNPCYQAHAQVLGLTNYSRWSDAAAVRACMAESTDLASSLMPAALASLQKFVHVGVTEQLEASIKSLAATMGMQMDGPSWEV